MKLSKNIDITKYDVGVIIGRFQVHKLHKAHCDVIETVLKNHKKVILFLGVTEVIGSSINPLDFGSRKIMIQEKYPDIIVLALPDKRNDETWSKNIDNRIKEVFPKSNPILYGSRDSFIPHYNGQFETAELQQEVYVSGTEIRKRISEEIKSSLEWRAGVIYGNYNKYETSYQRVDVAIFNEDESKILLCKKPEDDNYRFIGGFVKPNDVSLEVAAKRKVREKAGSIEISIDLYIGSFRVNDWRYRSEVDKVMSVLFKAKFIYGHLQPSDKISELRWISIDDLKLSLNNIIEEHRQMMSILLTK